ncbi:MAG: hypothetical protein PHD95_03500 [Candidatus ainarchaeum sp.]|nr:hypothetical protein [Candidatus ainarchaeum sp.]
MQEFFMPSDSEIETEQLQAATRKLIGFIKREKIGFIILEGRSARPIADLLKPAWANLNPGKPLPRMFAIGNRVKKFAGMDLDYSPTDYLTDKRLRTFDYSGLEKELSIAMPSLMQSKGQKVLLLTEWTDSGMSISCVKKIFEQIGFAKLSLGALLASASYTNKTREAKLDFLGATRLGSPSLYGKRRTANRALHRRLRLQMRKIGSSVRKPVKARRRR